MTRPSMPRSAMRRFVPAPSRKKGIARSLAPSIAFVSAAALLSSTKNSAGPPMPNDVCESSASPSTMPGSARSQATLDFVRQPIAQLLDIARAHQQDKVVGSDQLFESLLRRFEITDVNRIRDLMRKLGGRHSRDIVLTGAVHVEDEHPV